MAKIPRTLMLLSRWPASRTLLLGSTFILLYHEVSDKPSPFHQEGDLSVTPEGFEEQVAFFAGHFYALSPQELLKGGYPTPAFLVTFDDGAAGYFDKAVPVLEKYDCPSLIFLNMAAVQGEIFRPGLVAYLCRHVGTFQKFISGKGYATPEFLYITDEDLEVFLRTADREAIFAQAREYYGAFATEAMLEQQQHNRLVYFGNHLYNHHNAAALNRDQLAGSFRNNQKSLARFANALPFFSYPFGQQGSCYNDATTAALFGEGAQVIFSANPLSFKGQNGFFHRLPMTMEFTKDNLMAYLIGKKIQAGLKHG